MLYAWSSLLRLARNSKQTNTETSTNGNFRKFRLTKWVTSNTRHAKVILCLQCVYFKHRFDYCARNTNKIIRKHQKRHETHEMDFMWHKTYENNFVLAVTVFKTKIWLWYVKYKYNNIKRQQIAFLFDVMDLVIKRNG